MSEMELRELDAWIAEHVMEWERGWSSCAPRGLECHEKTFEHYGLWVDPTTGTQKRAHYFHPTTDPAAAMEVQRKLAERGGNVETFKGGDGHYYATDTYDLKVSAPTLELAICLLARKIYKTKEP